MFKILTSALVLLFCCKISFAQIATEKPETTQTIGTGMKINRAADDAAGLKQPLIIQAQDGQQADKPQPQQTVLQPATNAPANAAPADNSSKAKLLNTKRADPQSIEGRRNVAEPNQGVNSLTR